MITNPPTFTNLKKMKVDWHITKEYEYWGWMKIYYYLHGIMHAQKLFTLVLLVNTCTNDLHNLQIKVSMKFMYTRVGLMTLAIQV
jgi:hypothetical protein